MFPSALFRLTAMRQSSKLLSDVNIMLTRLRLLLSIFLLCGIVSLAHAQQTTPVIAIDNGPNALIQEQKHYVVLVSLDGFRYDYAKQYGATHLLALAKEGASAPDGMVPSYPS